MQNINSYLSQFDTYCEGYFPQKNNPHHYSLGINYAVSKVPILLSHEGSNNLDKIQAFDSAEVSEAHLGQINMITVSSFCGPEGKLWGLDIFLKNQIYEKALSEKFNISIFDASPLAEAFKTLTGTVNTPNFPFFPGSHVLCATKYLTEPGPCTLYSGIAIGIPKNRKKNAILLMEDVGKIPKSLNQEILKEKLCNSILLISQKQNVVYESIFVGIKSLSISKNEMGCALVACPYFLLAKNAKKLL